ncbi:J domain-containing protein [Algoriphagus sp. D3-2-R+10]|uniref:J domain-containing protein n=1 Tax=Algoriphagus aurantiacus TaxID=3103948 RepID=UPI002B3BE75A|nr:J domain-containing protein [Algoriphagus sp. D3-2-R+10]MEB2776380.1 J domain-containing protein [Algoriphagus sp. D3-2-R+10]
MARRPLSIPEEVKVKIREHISESYKNALDGYYSANEEEDALTGDLGATLRVKNQKVIVKSEKQSGTWTWSINYHKFRGRGPGATESLLGADGIFELSLKEGNYIQKKNLLFQSKMNWKDDPNLIQQTLKLTTWREAAFVLNFTPDVFEAIDLDTVISSRGKRLELTKTKKLDEFLGHDFLNCHVGDMDLKYDGKARKLIWRTNKGETVATKFSIPHRIAVEVKAPTRTHGNDMNYDREIPHDEIYKNRMEASKEDILSLEYNATLKELKKARIGKALIYHSDKFTFKDDLLNEIMKTRMHEVNQAHDSLKQKFKK